MKIQILAVGKIKDKWLLQGLAEYSKRLKSLADFSIYEGAEEKAPEGLSLKSIEQLKAKEGQRLLKQVRKGDYNIALDIQGKALSSVELAHLLEDLAIQGRPKINFFIGGSLGLSSEVLDACQISLSFSKLTFPHQLIRLILAEQIYRAFSIINKLPYHK